MARGTSKQEPVYGIGAVAKLTGLTDHTIRVWERRYGAVVAERAANGRRIYTAADVEKLRLLKRLTVQGFAIGQIADGGIEQLRKRIQDIGDVASASIPERVRIAVLGDSLPARLKAHDRDLSPVEVLVADTNREQFAADLRCHSADVVVVETPTLSADTASQVLEFMRDTGAAHGIIVYGFGRARDAAHARDANLIVLRAPVDIEDLLAAVSRCYTQPVCGDAPLKRFESGEPSSWVFSGVIAPRLFDQAQLAKLANTSSAIECECPQHLAQLVSDLSAFEIYSDNCANRDDDDAALHRYLHQTTAQARALIEVALKKVADTEGLVY